MKSRAKRLGQKQDVRLACSANFLTEGRGKKSSKEGKCVVSIFDDNEFYQARKWKQTTSKSKAMETNQTQLKQGKNYEKLFEEATKYSLRRNENIT